jgi:hypothetical protein
MKLVEAALQFPTVVFTIGLGIVLIYWLFVLLGALDLDLLGGGHADLDVSGGGGAEGLHVAGEAAGHGGDGGGGGHDGDGDADADSGPMHWLGLGVVPITISISIIMLVSWTGSLMAMSYLAGPDHGPDRPWTAGLVLVAVLVLALPVTGLLVRPLAPIFKIREGKTNRDYIGHLCTITTGHVDADFGQATLEDGGTELVIAVRCDRPGLARGGRALIIDFDDEREAYVVEPSADLLPEAAAKDPTATS